MLSLTQVLKINAGSSGISGLAMIIFAKPLAAIFGVSALAPFVVTGIGLVAFALFVLKVANRKPLDPSQVRAIIRMDVLWVIGSIVAVLLLNGTITTTGIYMIIAVAIWVAIMAYMQYNRLSGGMMA